MKKKILALALAISVTFGLCGCGDMETTTMVAGSSNASKQEPEKISFLADFYDNHGDMWLSVEGTSFSISPNKIKEYYFDTDGDWTYHYTMSSIMSIDIDGQSVESCGSTVIFADSRLEKFNIDIPKEITSSTGTTATVETPTDLSAEDIVDAAILKSRKICLEQIATCPANRPDLMEGFMLCKFYIDELAPKNDG